MSSVIAKLDLDPTVNTGGLSDILLNFVPGATYEASYWSSETQLRLFYYRIADGNTQLLINPTVNGEWTGGFSTWALGDLVPISLANDVVGALGNWTTFILQSGEEYSADVQLTLARDESGAALYIPTLDNVLAVNQAHAGGVTLSGNFVQGQEIELNSTELVDGDGLNSLSYVWQKALATNSVTLEGSWVDVLEATAAQFTLTKDEVNFYLRVKVTYTDSLGYQETVTSAVSSSAVIQNDAPVAGVSTVYFGKGDDVYTFNADDFAFTDADTGDTLSAIALTGLPSAGTLKFMGDTVIPAKITLAQLQAGDLQWTPAANSFTPAELSFLVFDSKQTVSVTPGLLTLEGSNRPTSGDSRIEVTTPIGIRPEDFIFNDLDLDDSLQSITIMKVPANGYLTLLDPVNSTEIQVVDNQVIYWEDMWNFDFSYTPVFGSGVASYDDHLLFKVSDSKVESSLTYDLQLNALDPDPSGTTDIAGQALHWKGLSPVPIAGVSVAIGSNAPITTDSTGQFTLTGADLSLGSQATASVATPFANKTDAGITLTDVLATLKVYLGRDLPSDYASPFNVVAADFDANGVVNLSDVLGLLKYYLGRPGAPTPSWAFVDATDVVSVNGQQKIMGANGYLTKSDVHLDPMSVGTDPTTPVEIIGVIRGDVDGSWAALPHPIL